MLRLKRPLRPSSNADPEDTLATKLHLADLGLYDPPTGEFHGWPDSELFASLRKAQEFVGETPDGGMLPGGPTEAALNRLAASRPPIPEEKPNDYPSALAMGLVRPKDARSDTESWRDAVRFQTGMQTTPVAATDRYGGRRMPPPEVTDPLDNLMFGGRLFGGGGGGGGSSLGGRSAAPRPPSLLDEPAAGSNRGNTADPSLMEAEGWHRDALPPQKHEPMRGPSAEEIDRLNKEFSKPLTGPAPQPIEVTSESFPAELPAAPQILIFPDFLGEFDQLNILEDRKGNSKTKAQIDSIRDWFLDRKWTHVAGGRDRDKKLETPELWIPNSAYMFGGDGRRGGRFVDLTMKSPDGQIVHIQTVTLDKNGKPTAAELEAAEAIRRATGQHVILIPKNWQLRRGGNRLGK